MCGMMMPRTKPQDLKRLGIVAMMPVDLGIAADLTRETLDLPIAHGIA
jgi:hypothetical protein